MSEVEKSLGTLAQEINAEHRAFVGAFRKTVEHGIRAGELLAKAKEQCPHGTWLGWLEENFEGAARTAQEYLRLYNHRDEIREKTRDSAHLSVSGALKELAAPTRPEGIPPEEWAIIKHATEDVSYFPTWDPGSIAERPEHERRGWVAQMAWEAMLMQGRAYAEIRDIVGEVATTPELTPELLTRLQDEANKLRWWVAQVEWIEQLVRACDWPPGGGMPSAAFDERKKDLPLSRLYGDELQQQYGDALQSPRGRIREFCGPVV